MKSLKKFATTLTLAGIIMMGITSAKAGILMGDLSGGNDKQQTCSQSAVDGKGIIVSGFTGIIVSGFTGIIVSGFTGIIVSGFGDSDKVCAK